MAAVLAFGAPARAQQSADGAIARATPIERFRPLPVQRTSLLGLSTTDVLPHLTPSAGLFIHAADDPLVVVERRDGQRTVHRLVDERLYAEFGAGIGLFDRLQLGIALPMILQRGDFLDEARGPIDRYPGFVFGDLRVAPRLQLVAPDNPAGLGLAVAAPLHLPVGTGAWFESGGAPRVEGRLIADWQPTGRLRVVTNAGWEVRPRRRLQNRVLDDAVVLGAGAHLDVGPALAGGASTRLLATLSGEIPVLGDDAPTLEAIGAIRVPLSESLRLQAGGGAGFLSGVGSPDARALVGLEYAPEPRNRDGDALVDEADRCPGKREDEDGFRDNDGCPDPDNDGDGVADWPDPTDQCPDSPEDPDGHRDDDGCPDPDNDGDGIDDIEDACPDRAGSTQKDGCPLVDVDGDGIDDSVDVDPTAAEDFDGSRDDDGAPDPDNDSDGIPDQEDQCPDEAETINGVDDADGCPDEGRSGVAIQAGKIEIDEQLHFDSDRATIKQRSFGILEQVAATLKARTAIKKVRIEGHTDGRGRDLYNLALSQRRANAVRAFLVDRGVAPDRLTTRGYGENEPIATNDTEEGRRENRRVEITILKVETEDDDE